MEQEMADGIPGKSQYFFFFKANKGGGEGELKESTENVHLSTGIRDNVQCACILSFSVMSDCLQPHRLYSPPGSSVHGIFQARVLEWVDISSCR